MTDISRPPAIVRAAPQRGGLPPAGVLAPHQARPGHLAGAARQVPEVLPPEGETARPAWVREYDCWAASYDRSPLQAVAVAAPGRHRACFTAAAAERLPFGGGVFDLVVATLSVSHWGDAAAGLTEISRVMAPGATLVAADVYRARPSRSMALGLRRREPDRSQILPSLVAASGLRTKRVDPIRSVALIADAVLVTARKQH